MKRHLKTISMWVLLSLAGCYTIQEVPVDELRKLDGYRNDGPDISLKSMDGQPIAFRHATSLSFVTEDSQTPFRRFSGINATPLHLVGREQDTNALVDVDLDRVSMAKIENFSAGKTVGLSIGLGIGIPVTIAGLIFGVVLLVLSQSNWTGQAGR